MMKAALLCRESKYQAYLAREFEPLHQSYVDANIDTWQSHHKQHVETIAHCRKTLAKFDINVEEIDRLSPPTELTGYDVAISIGGDGTLLNLARRIHTPIPIISVNSAPTQSLGALCNCESATFEALLRSVINRRCACQALTRIQVTLNNLPIPHAILNDALFASPNPAKAVNYTLCTGKCERQSSSGVWIATPTGSTAAIASAGGTPIPRTETRLQYLVREPILNRLIKSQNLHGFLDPDSPPLTLQVHSLQAALYLDGTLENIALENGDILVFRQANSPIYLAK